MLHAELLAILRCPDDHSKLSAADPATVARLNEAVAAGQLKNRGGQQVERQIGGALIRADGQLLYPIIDQIPVLLVDEAIWTNAIES